jgi:hypothetical protein
MPLIDDIKALAEMPISLEPQGPIDMRVVVMLRPHRSDRLNGYWLETIPFSGRNMAEIFFFRSERQLRDLLDMLEDRGNATEEIVAIVDRTAKYSARRINH